MPESDKKIKHFIFMRFFTFRDPKYPYDIYDTNFLSKQLVFAQNNALPSLENQTDKNFELVFLVNHKFLTDKKYEFIFSTLKESTTLPLTFIRQNDIPKLVNDAYDNYDFVIQSRMDFDDFVYKDAIADTHSKINECENILAYGYCKGYIYINKDLYNWKVLFKGIGHYALMQSLMLKSSFAKELPFIGIYTFDHTRVKPILKDFLEKNGIAFSENMFQQNAQTLAYIYFRHEFSHNDLVSNPGKTARISKQLQSITEGLTKKQLADEFGFHYELNSIK